jgi:hypothetical protein
MTLSCIYMIHILEPRLRKFLLAQIIQQASTTLAIDIRRVYRIENHYGHA